MIGMIFADRVRDVSDDLVYIAEVVPNWSVTLAYVAGIAFLRDRHDARGALVSPFRAGRYDGPQQLPIAVAGDDLAFLVLQTGSA